jgi:ribose transport system ATP-binding protein
MEKPILKVTGIVKNFPGVKALKGVDFDVRAGEVHALCGENGAGKSTLMHILSGVYQPDEGEIYLEGKKVHFHNQKEANEQGIAIVYQERSLVEGLNVAENVFAARQPSNKFSWIHWKQLYRETEEILKSLDIQVNPKTMVSSLSPALQQMVEIAKALSLKPKVLILDEPTAAITEKEVVALFRLIEKLKKEGMAIIYISHRLVEIFQLAERVTVFKDGSLVETANVYDVDNNWLVNRMVGRDLELKRLEREIPKDVVLSAKGLCGGSFRNVSFELNRGEIVGFAGLAGAGRTEVMRAIFGADPILEGEIYLNGSKMHPKNTKDSIERGIGYLPEDRKAQGLFLEMSISDNISSAHMNRCGRGLFLDEKKLLSESEKYKEQLRVATPSVRQKVVNLSGGNQQKVVFARWLMVNPRIMIVDEPTRGVDVGAKAEIYQILREMTKKGTSIILVSSDLPEVMSISDRIYVMHEGEITGEISGTEATEEAIMRLASGIRDE